jgi:hypothetical protein
MFVNMKEIETSDVTDLLVGITPAYLNTFLQRKLYGIAPSVRVGKVREKRRLFSEADVFGIALVWMLFESGLRTQPIRRILNELAGTKKADARIAAESLLQSQAEYIVIVREPRKPKGKTEVEPNIRTANQGELAVIVKDNPTANIVMVPVGAKFEDIKRRLQVLY